MDRHGLSEARIDDEAAGRWCSIESFAWPATAERADTGSQHRRAVRLLQRLAFRATWELAGRALAADELGNYSEA